MGLRTFQLPEHHFNCSYFSGLHSDHCCVLLSLLRSVLVQLFWVLLSQLMVLGLPVCHNLSEILRSGASNSMVNPKLIICFYRPFSFSLCFFMKSSSSLEVSISMSSCCQVIIGIIKNLVRSMDITLHRLVHDKLCLIFDSEVISRTKGIGSLQNYVGIVHRICKDLSPQLLDGLEVISPIPDPHSFLFQVFPDLDLQSLVMSLLAPHPVYRGGQTVIQKGNPFSAGMHLIPTRPLTIPMAMNQDFQLPCKLVERDIKIHKPDFHCLHRSWSCC